MKVGPNAFVIGAISTKDPLFFGMALHCAKTIRRQGYGDDIIFFTCDMPPAHKEIIKTLKYKVIEREPLDFPGIPTQMIEWCDAQKMQYWSLTQYHNIVALDADIEFKRPRKPKSDLWKFEELTCQIGGDVAPINSGALFIQPDSTTYAEMIDIIQGGFEPERGWGGHGTFSFREKYYHDWAFPSAGGAQGFLFYYFHLLNKSLHVGTAFQQWFTHYAGKSKQQEDYVKKVKAALKDKLTMI